MSTWKSVLESLNIRVAVIYLDDSLRVENNYNYLELLKKSSPIPRNSLKGTVDGPFTKNFTGDGEIHLDFIPEHMISSDLDDLVDIQLFRKIFAVIGIGVSTDPNVSLNYEKFIEKTRKMSQTANDVITRCFVFGEGRPEGISDNVTLIPEKEQESSIKTLINELTLAILIKFNTIAAELTKREIIPSPRKFDDKITKDQTYRLKTRKAGRLAKLLGDLCLLAGMVPDAVNQFVTASEESKIHSDLIWHAGGEEGLQISLVLKNEQILAESRKDATGSLWISLPDKLREVAPLYQKADMPLMAFEVFRTIAGLLNYAGSPAEAAMSLCQGWVIHRFLSFADKLYVLTVIIDRFTLLKMKRKRAFFLIALANLLNVNKEEEMALAVLSKSFFTYKIDLNQAALHDAWPAIRLAVLRKAAVIAESHVNAKLIVEFYTAILGYSVSRMDSEDQIRISRILKKRIRQDPSTSFSNLPPQPCLLPLLVSINIKTKPEDLWRQVTSKKTTNSDHFIYNPFSKNAPTAKVSLAIAVGGTLQVDVYFGNPYAFPIDLAHIRLLDKENSSLITNPVFTTIPAWTKSQRVALTCTSMEQGSLCITAVEFILFGMKMVITNPQADSASTLAVIPRQPILKLSDTLQSGALSLLSGQEISYDLTVSNFGDSEANDLDIDVIVEWDDDALKNCSSVDEIIFRPSYKPVKYIGEKSFSVASQSQSKIPFSIQGIPGIKCAQLMLRHKVQVDSGLLYCRTISRNLIFNITPGIEILHITTLPYHSIHNFTFDASLGFRNGAAATSNSFLPQVNDNADEPNPGEYCLLVLDIRNNHSDTMIMSVSPHNDAEHNARIPPCQNKRIVFPFKRLHIPAKLLKSQIPFVGSQVSALRKMYPSDYEIYAICRKWYWAKLNLIKSLKLSWQCSQKNGIIDFHAANLEKAFLTHLLKDDISFNVKVNDKLVEHHNSLPIGKFHHFTINIDNSDIDAGEEEEYILRAQPVLHISDDEFGIELEDVMCLTGILQTTFTHRQFTHNFSLLALIPCRIHILLHIERLSDANLTRYRDSLIIDFKKTFI